MLLSLVVDLTDLKVSISYYLFLAIFYDDNAPSNAGHWKCILNYIYVLEEWNLDYFSPSLLELEISVLDFVIMAKANH